MSTITAADFIKKLGARDLPGGRLEVRGDVNLSNTPIERPPSFANVVFHGEVSFAGARIRGDIDFSRCTFLKRLDLRGVAVSGDLLLDEAEIFARGSLGNQIYIALDVSATAIDGAVRAKLLVVDGIVSGAGGKFTGGLDFSGSQIRQLQLNNAAISGGLQLSSIAYLEQDKMLQTKMIVVDATGANINGGVNVLGAEISILVLENSGVTGNLSFNSIVTGSITFWTNINIVHAKGVTIRGDMILSRLVTENLILELGTVEGDLLAVGSSFIGAVNCDNASVGGDFILTKTEVEKPPSPEREANISGRNLKVGGASTFLGIQARSMQLDGAAFGGGLRIAPSGRFRPRIRGELNLSNLQGEPFIQIEALDNDGGIMILSGEMGELRFRPGIVECRTGDGKPSIDILPCRTARLFLQNTTIQGGLSLRLLQVDGTIDTYGYSGVAIENCEIKGNLEFWNPTLFQDLAHEVARRQELLSGIGIEDVKDDLEPELPPDFPKLSPEDQQRHLEDARRKVIADWRKRVVNEIEELPPWEYGASVVGPVSIRNTKIGGKCVLSFLKASGKIEVTDGTINNDLDFQSTLSLADRNAPAASSQQFPQRAYAAGLSVRKLAVNNDIDLTGLTLFEDGGGPWCNDEAECGNLDARFLEVSGDIVAHRRYDPLNESPEAYVEVPGALDLAFATGRRLTVSGHSFPPPGVVDDPSRKAQDYGIVLGHATFRQVSFPHIEARSGNGCPIPLDLTAVSVTDWEIGSVDTPLQKRYATLLDNARPFRRDNYRSIEQHLRDQGNDREADSVYRAMMVRERGERGRDALFFLSVPKYHAFKWLLGFGTNLWPLFLVIVALAAVSYPVYRNPVNIEPSLAKLATAATRETAGRANKFIFAGQHPDAEQWNVWDALWLMARTHIPIISLAVRDEWELSDDPRFTYDLGAFMSGEGWCKGEEKLIGLGPTSRWLCKRSAYERRGLSPQDWGAVMMILSWILWPLLLAFLLPRLLRR